MAAITLYPHAAAEYASFTSGGLAEAANYLGLARGGWVYVALGNDDTTPAITDTGLGNEIARAAVAYTRSGATVTFTLTWTATVAFTCKEFGVFDAGMGGNCLYHRLTASQAVVVGDVCTLRDSIIVAQGSYS